jgi:hypothetical protein
LKVEENRKTPACRAGHLNEGRRSPVKSRNYTPEEYELIGPLFKQHPDAVVYSGSLDTIRWAVEWLRQYAGEAPTYTTALTDAHHQGVRWYDHWRKYENEPPGVPPQCPSAGDFAIAAAFLGYSLRKVRGHWQADLYIDRVEPLSKEIK